MQNTRFIFVRFGYSRRKCHAWIKLILLNETRFSNDETLMILGRVLEPERSVIHDLTSTLNQQYVYAS